MTDIIAEVAVFAPIKQPLSYLVPQELKSILKPGSLVKIPLGRQTSIGLVTQIYTKNINEIQYKLKHILTSIYDCPITSSEMITLYKWMHRYYISDLFSIIDIAIPNVIRKKLPLKLETFLELSPNINNSQQSLLQIDPKKTPKQHEAFQYILQKKRISKKEMQQQFSATIVNSLLKKNLIYETFQRTDRIAFQEYSKDTNTQNHAQSITLTPTQQQIADEIYADIINRQFVVHAIDGATGSGKTEIYIDLIKRILHQCGSVLYLVPEITIASQILFRLREKLSNECPIYIWHSGLSDGEKHDAWMYAINNKSTAIIGTRSALFMPQNNLRLIIVDEEHDTSYKQNEYPRYHARDVAIMKAKFHSAVCILGSATLSFETLSNATTGKYKSHKISSSYHKSKTAIGIINMADEPHGMLISQRLNYKIAECLDVRKQVILFLNRRGFATTVFCQKCNIIITCPKCNIPMIFHKCNNTIRCHLCGFSEQFQSQCKNCHTNSVYYRGTGTQRAENILSKLYPEAKIARIDSDVLSKKYAHIEILQQFKNQQIDILLGTQILSKSLNFDNVKLIGVLNADSGLNIPNFRANEQALQLLLQLSGRTGRRLENGQVLIQTHIPQHPIFSALTHDGYHDFATQEMQIRQEFLYPPYCRLINIICESEIQHFVKSVAEKIYLSLYNFCNQNQLHQYININHPIEPFFSQINNKHRYSIVIKTTKIMAINNILREVRDQFYDKDKIKIIIDVDPVDLC